MKKTLLWGAIASLFFASCSKNDMVVEPIEPSEDFVAQLANASRTELDNTSVIWNAEDELTIFTKTEHNRQYKVKTLSEDGRTATFGFVGYTGTSNGTISANYAIYPYDAQATLSGDVISTTIASEQQYNVEKVDLSYALMAAKSETTSFAFVNAGALIRFNIAKSELIPDSYTLNSIKLSSVTNNIAGNVTIDLSAESRAVVASTGSKEITLTAINQEITEEAKAFYVALPAVSFADKDLTVTFTFADGEKSFTLPAFDLLQGSIKTIAYTINDSDDFTGTTPDSGEDFEGETPGEETYPANNEIWYTTTTGQPVDYLGDAISNTYENGKGVAVFTNDVTTITFDATSIETITLPISVIHMEAVHGTSLKQIISKYASQDGRCLIVDGVVEGFAYGGITEYTFPDGITKIGNTIAQGAANLNKVTISEGVTEIGEYAFSQKRFFNSNAFEVVLPSTLKTIGKSAFVSNNLTTITIPANVTSIGSYAFSDNSNLTEVYCAAVNPPVGGDSMFGDTTTSIYVPTTSVEAYKAADYWKDYNIIGYDF